MKLIIRYIFFIFIGILIYILLNRYEKFNISALPWVYLDIPNHNTLINNPVQYFFSNAVEDEASDRGYEQENIDNGTRPLSIPITRKIGYLLDSEKTKQLNEDFQFSPNFDDLVEPDCSDPNDTSDCYYRKINTLDSNNSEFYINLVDQTTIQDNSDIMNDEITGKQVNKFDLHLDTIQEPEYKLFVTDNLSLLKIYSLLNKYYIENIGNSDNIPKPILYFSCHAEYLDDPHLNIDTTTYLHRDLKYHVVDEDGDVKKGCSIQSIVNLPDLSFNQSDPKVSISENPKKFYSHYQIPLYFKNDEFVDATHNAFLDCSVCYMVILYKKNNNEDDENYYQYGSSTISNDDDKNKNKNLMTLFSMITNIIYEGSYFGVKQQKKVPILFKSYNLQDLYIEKFPRYKYYDVNGLWKEIIDKLLTFQDSISVNNKDNDNYPLNLFLDACIKAYKDENIRRGCKFWNIVKKIEDDNANADGNYDPIWDILEQLNTFNTHQTIFTQQTTTENCHKPLKRDRDDDPDDPDNPDNNPYNKPRNECASSGQGEVY